MKKVIRLTESELTRIIKRIIKENEDDINMSNYSDNDRLKGLKSQIITYLNDNGVYPNEESDDDIIDELSTLYRQGDRQAIRFVRRLS
jgi:hypothetical protein